MLRFKTTGESHGKCLTGIIEGIPSGLALSAQDINPELKRRQKGYGRGGRMKIESDAVEILSGVRWGKTIGSPITLQIQNRDWENWNKAMSANAEDEGAKPAITRPRPGHADLSGALKFNQRDIRNILERSSARETAMRVALGAVAKKFLAGFGVEFGSFVTRIGPVETLSSPPFLEKELKEFFRIAEESEVSCPVPEMESSIKDAIKKAMEEGDTLGGRFVVFATGVPVGLGSHIQWDTRLDGLLAQAVMSIQAIKSVEVGAGLNLSSARGSSVMDEIFYSGKNFSRSTNNMGGIEGGISNGMPLIIQAGMKPIPTLKKPLRSADMISKEPFEAVYERSDTCAVPAAAVIAEAMAALVLARSFLEKFGGDSVEETGRNYDSYRQYLSEF